MSSHKIADNKAKVEAFKSSFCSIKSSLGIGIDFYICFA